MWRGVDGPAAALHAPAAGSRVVLGRSVSPLAHELPTLSASMVRALDESGKGHFAWVESFHENREGAVGTLSERRAS